MLATYNYFIQKTVVYSLITGTFFSNLLRPVEFIDYFELKFLNVSVSIFSFRPAQVPYPQKTPLH